MTQRSGLKVQLRIKIQVRDKHHQQMSKSLILVGQVANVMNNVKGIRIRTLLVRQ